VAVRSNTSLGALASFGRAGNGQVYLGKWHNSECAVKCLNQSLFFSDGPGGQVSMAAITDLIHEADLLGGLRHPNVVWVYGIVLPRLDESEVGGCKVIPSPLSFLGCFWRLSYRIVANRYLRGSAQSILINHWGGEDNGSFCLVNNNVSDIYWRHYGFSSTNQGQ
jgi:serine/threonine protein kinase